MILNFIIRRHRLIIDVCSLFRGKHWCLPFLHLKFQESRFKFPGPTKKALQGVNPYDLFPGYRDQGRDETNSFLESNSCSSVLRISQTPKNVGSNLVAF